ncbi:HECT domain-containing protein [Forsythia ovata]|uniref:HECT domain-containing protein n=1 Tax=Forsythia ovata TaxID=205694 RepID=A0ABD1P020_9LAMI
MRNSYATVPHGRYTSYPCLKVQFVKANGEISLRDYTEDVVSLIPFCLSMKLKDIYGLKRRSLTFDWKTIDAADVTDVHKLDTATRSINGVPTKGKMMESSCSHSSSASSHSQGKSPKFMLDGAATKDKIVSCPSNVLKIVIKNKCILHSFTSYGESNIWLDTATRSINGEATKDKMFATKDKMSL